jgi:hypothetical protein
MVRQPDPDTLISVPHQAPPQRTSWLTTCLLFGGLLVLVGGGAGLAVYCFNLPEDSVEKGKDDESQAVFFQENAQEADSTNAKGEKKGDKQGKTNKAAKLSKTNKPAAPLGVKPLPKFKEPPWVAQSARNGLLYLRKHVQTDGKWSAAPQPTGYAALTGLTLLECGANAKDPLVLMARKEVLGRAAPLQGTYEISLTVLFLDRLGMKQDEALIRHLALRLVSGQRADGGWTYECPILPEPEHNQLLRFLQDNRLNLRELVRPEEFRMFVPGQVKAAPAKKGPAPKAKPGRALMTAEKLPEAYRNLPVVKQGKVDPPQASGVGGRSDNSNSQFAMLALWVAQRHGIPMERTFNLVDQRFRNTQAAEGSWSYTPDQLDTRPAMTCAGLLGLGVGHGSAHQVALREAGQKPKPADTPEPSLQDPVLQKGLHYLGQQIGHPIPQPNLYFLWSVERVAVLYHLDKIDGKDWYTWGAKALLATQNEDGSWSVPNGYWGANPTLDTCFALLFLKKANFVPGLTNNLREYLQVRERE